MKIFILSLGLLLLCPNFSHAQSNKKPPEPSLFASTNLGFLYGLFPGVGVSRYRSTVDSADTSADLRASSVMLSLELRKNLMEINDHLAFGIEARPNIDLGTSGAGYDIQLDLPVLLGVYTGGLATFRSVEVGGSSLRMGMAGTQQIVLDEDFTRDFFTSFCVGFSTKLGAYARRKNVIALNMLYYHGPRIRQNISDDALPSEIVMNRFRKLMITVQYYFNY